MDLQRRSVLGGAALLTGVGGCAPISPRLPDPDPSLKPLADAHAHLFNGADLPVGKFAQYVVLPEKFPELPPFLGALADIALNIVKLFVIPADRERVRALRENSREPNVTPGEFGKAVSDRIRALDRNDRGIAPAGETPLIESYRALVVLLSGQLQGPAGLTAADVAPQGGREDLARAGRAVFAAVAREAIALSPAAAAPPGTGMAAEGFAKRLVAWIYLMTLSRQNHLAKYLTEYGASDATPRLIVNHLVDYDRWLGDAPVGGSTTPKQVAFWARVAEARRSRVDILTFAPFCPLKHAIETAEKDPRMFGHLRGAYASKQIAGVKLYPPMGFQAAGNARIKDTWPGWTKRNDEFTSPKDRGLERTAVNAWARAAGEDAELGPALDAAMAEFLAWAQDGDVPLMTHAGPGNAAGPGFGSRANPKWWEQAIRATGRPLRLSLGHLVKDARPFVDAVRTLQNGGSVDLSRPEHWALDAPLRLLAPTRQGASSVFGDLAYMPELVADEDLAKAFFVAMKATFGKFDPNLEQILYGTDWIMFALEADGESFPEEIRRAMHDAGLKDAIENVRWKNARRFLKLDPPDRDEGARRQLSR